MIEIDGSRGEGGGQVLRTALALSAATGTPFRIDAIRAGRDRPGIRPQHRAAIEAAAAICDARVEGGGPGERSLVFRPGTVRGGAYSFAVGTAGSTTLVLQTVLPALASADAPSTVTLQGGTHNPWSPPFEFLARAWLPLLARMGVRAQATLERAGFHPAGGGLLRAEIEGGARGTPLVLEERGPVRRRLVRAVLANLPLHVAERELATATRALRWRPDETELAAVAGDGPGNALSCIVESREVTAVFTAFGRIGVPAEKVAREAVRDVRAYLRGGAPVDARLADQLMVPLALAGGGTFLTGPLTPHARTNLDTIAAFDVAPLRAEEAGGGRIRVVAGGPPPGGC